MCMAKKVQAIKQSRIKCKLLCAERALMVKNFIDFFLFEFFVLQGDMLRFFLYIAFSNAKLMKEKISIDVILCTIVQ